MTDGSARRALLPAVIGSALGVVPAAAPYWLHAVPAPQQ